MNKNLADQAVQHAREAAALAAETIATAHVLVEAADEAAAELDECWSSEAAAACKVADAAADEAVAIAESACQHAARIGELADAVVTAAENMAKDQ